MEVVSSFACLKSIPFLNIEGAYKVLNIGYLKYKTIHNSKIMLLLGGL